MKQYTYTIILAHEEGGGYLAFCPTVPRCSASGRTKKETIGRIEAALGRRLDRLAARGKSVPPGCCLRKACTA